MSRLDARGMRIAETAMTSTYSAGNWLAGPPVTCTTTVISAKSNNACAYRNVIPGRALRMWVYHTDGAVTRTPASAATASATMYSGGMARNERAAATKTTVPTVTRPRYTHCSSQRVEGMPRSVRAPDLFAADRPLTSRMAPSILRTLAKCNTLPKAGAGPETAAGWISWRGCA